MTYGDKTWCMAKCKADGSCGRKLTSTEINQINIRRIPVSFADFSAGCDLFEPDESGGESAVVEFLRKLRND